MSALLTPIQPRRALFSCDEFHDMGDSGVFEGRSVILVDGEILDMPNPNPPHDAAVGLADYLLKDLFSPGYTVRIQMGFPTSNDTDLVPDIAVVPGSPRDYAKEHPRKAVLIVEVVESWRSYETDDKALLYAAAGVEDYWVVSLADRQQYVFRDPIVDSASPSGFTYGTCRTLTQIDSVSPLSKPTVKFAVAELMP